MAIRVFNTLSRKLTPVRPRDGKTIRFYSCGPTVYNYVHIGNLRAYVFLDVFKRYLKFRGYKIKHVMNITDVGHLTSDADTGEDKIEQEAKKEKKTAKEITRFYTKIFKENLKNLNITEPDVWCKATQHIKEQIELIKNLEEKGYVYKTSDGVYFDTNKFKDYGKLAELEKKGLKGGIRVPLGEKKHKTDFALWKFSKKPGLRQQEWSSPWGLGFPGWHIECSAMAMKYLGPELDIHSGGIDLIFPHHTNEIAQSESATGKKFSKIWIHNAHLLADGKKMSKSLGNFYTLKDIASRGYHPLLLRYVLMRTHFQETLDFTFLKFDEARQILTDIIWLIDDLHSVDNKAANDINIGKIIKNNKAEFIRAMDENLNISIAFKTLFQFTSETRRLLGQLNKKQAGKIIDYLYELDAVLGFLEPLYKEYKSEKEVLLKDPSIVQLLKKRAAFRKVGNFKESDKIRNLLLEKSIRINDLPAGRFSVYIEKFL